MSKLKISWLDLERYWREPASFYRNVVVAGGYPVETPDLKKRYELLLTESFLHGSSTAWRDKAQIIYEDNRRSNATKALEIAAFKDNKVPLLTSEYNEFDTNFVTYARLMQDWFHGQPVVAAISNPHLPQLELSGTVLLTEAGDPVFIKVVDDVSAFPNTCFQARYDRLAAFTAILLGTKLTTSFLVCDLKEPARAAVYELGAESDSLGLAYNEVSNMLASLNTAVEFNRFDNYAPKPIQLVRPHWLPVINSLNQTGVHLWPTSQIQ